MAHVLSAPPAGVFTHSHPAVVSVQPQPLLPPSVPAPPAVVPVEPPVPVVPVVPVLPAVPAGPPAPPPSAAPAALMLGQFAAQDGHACWAHWQKERYSAFVAAQIAESLITHATQGAEARHAPAVSPQLLLAHA